MNVDEQLSSKVLTPFPRDVRIDLPGLVKSEDRIIYYSRITG